METEPSRSHSEPRSFRKGLDPRAFDVAGSERYDAVVATVPSDTFLELLDADLRAQLSPESTERLEAAEYHAAHCLLLELDRVFSPYYWTNVVDPEFPFIALIEHTNLVDPARYDGRRFLWVGNYRENDDEVLALDADELLELYEPFLRRVNPAFHRGWIKQRWLFREPAAQPIISVGYQRRIPPLETGVPGLVLANLTQVYPEDRGTNYAVRLANQAAQLFAGGA